MRRIGVYFVAVLFLCAVSTLAEGLLLFAVGEEPEPKDSWLEVLLVEAEQVEEEKCRFSLLGFVDNQTLLVEHDGVLLGLDYLDASLELAIEVNTEEVSIELPDEVEDLSNLIEVIDLGLGNLVVLTRHGVWLYNPTEGLESIDLLPNLSSSPVGSSIQLVHTGITYNPRFFRSSWIVELYLQVGTEQVRGVYSPLTDGLNLGYVSAKWSSDNILALVRDEGDQGWLEVYLYSAQGEVEELSVVPLHSYEKVEYFWSQDGTTLAVWRDTNVGSYLVVYPVRDSLMYWGYDRTEVLCDAQS